MEQQLQDIGWPRAAVQDRYDYIVAGAGCAGLSLLVHLVQSGRLQDKRILVIDSDLKNRNDRTWCFWEKEAGPFQPIVCKEWDQLWFHSNALSRLLTPAPYTYKMIRGIDFYHYSRSILAQHGGISFTRASIEGMESRPGETFVQADGQKLYADYIFNSVPPPQPRLLPHQYWLLQHFKGWMVETAGAAFSPGVATLMDMRTCQKNGTAFFYVLPVAPNRALVEYTVFSKNLLPDTAYEAELKAYVEGRLQLRNYSITEKEFGVIPMTNYSFPSSQGNILHIGTAGGQTKGSSGYTFRFIQKQSAAMVQHLVRTGTPFSPRSSPRFHFYDSVLLNILDKNSLPGDRIFAQLFRRNPTPRVLKFLDNETSLPEDLRLLCTLPTFPFFRSAVQHLWAHAGGQ
ncbi:lycopene cyclase family protein [Paraflavisolibacter sp. H34]|uniref:lycopene cyclase family protein n=1 Tax=Huijunlia imazamoxiresistens TaxID=3127457 RepID=UPI00301A5171